MMPQRKKCPHVVHFNAPRDWFETNLRHQKRYSEGSKKIRGCCGLLGRVIQMLLFPTSREIIFYFQHFIQICFYFLGKKLGGTPPPAPPLAAALLSSVCCEYKSVLTLLLIQLC